MIQIPYKCVYYSKSENLNKTCDNKARCKIYYDEFCNEYEKKEDEESDVIILYSEEDIKPFLDPYFKGLDFRTIAELAKKSIRITAYNSELEHKIELMDEKVDALIENCELLKGENEEYIKIDEVLSILK